MWRILPLNRSNIRLDGCLDNRNIVSMLIHYSTNVLEILQEKIKKPSPVTQAQDVAHHGHHGQ